MILRRLVPVAAVAAAAALAIAVSNGGAGDEISVFPSHTTLAAAVETTVVVRGAGPDELEDVSVTGSGSGEHAGEWAEHPDGDGAVFTPEEPFEHGERVTVDAGMRIAGADEDKSSFTITRRNTAPDPPDDQAKAPKRQGVQVFRSQPELRPPGVEVRIPGEDAVEGSVFVAPKRGATQQGPMIVDGDGELVWFHPLPGNTQAFDFRAQTYRDRPVVTWWEGEMQLYRGGGVGKILDTRYEEIATVRAGNGYEMDAHEMKLTPAGTALTMSYYVVPWDLTNLGGRRDGLVEDNVVQEIDVETGAVLWEWHTLGSIPLGESYRPAPKERGKIHDPWHLNSVELDEDGDFIVSARHTNALYKVDRDTAEVEWRLGGKESDFRMGRGARFALQHDARVHGDGTISLFDNVAEDLPARGRQSRGITLRIDTDEDSATLVREFQHPDKILSATQGSMQVLEGGGAFVGWGGLHPEFTEFDAEGTPVFDARFTAKGVETYRAYRMPWEGEGEDEPRAVRRGGTVHASWNGASHVARWRVLPGGTTAPRSGFETTIPVDGPARRVEALDEAGEVLGAATVAR